MTGPEQHANTVREQVFKNTDRELWREVPEGESMSYYSPSIHVTEQGGIGINVGGTVYVRTLREWHALAERADTLERERDEAQQWWEDNFATPDDEPPDPDTAQMLDFVFRWGNSAWGAAGQESQRAEQARAEADRLREALQRAELLAAEWLQDSRGGSMERALAEIRAELLARAALAGPQTAAEKPCPECADDGTGARFVLDDGWFGSRKLTGPEQHADTVDGTPAAYSEGSGSLGPGHCSICHRTWVYSCSRRLYVASCDCHKPRSAYRKEQP